MLMKMTKKGRCLKEQEEEEEEPRAGNLSAIAERPDQLPANGLELVSR